MKKKLLSYLMSACLLLGTAPAFAMPGDVTTDPADDFSLLYDYSEFWEIKSNNADKLNNDTGRFQRTSGAMGEDAEDYQYLTYYHKNPESVQVLLYYTDVAFVNAVTIQCSPDNVDYTEVSYTTTADSGYAGAWGGSFLKAENLPDGTQYIRIELDKTATSRTGCGIGEVQITEGAAAYENTVISEAGGTAVIQDDLENMDLIFEKKGTWIIDQSNPDKFSSDSRIRRDKDEDSSLTWKIPKLLKVDMVLYHVNSIKVYQDYVTLEYSFDNETWYPLEVKGSSTGISDWYRVNLSAEIPENAAEYLRATIKTTGNVWAIGFGGLTFTVKNPYELKDGEITLSDGVANASFTIVTNQEIYEKITMYLASYDANGALTGLSAKTVPAPLGENPIHGTLTVPAGTKTVRAYFLNGLWGLHRVCETVEKKL